MGSGATCDLTNGYPSLKLPQSVRGTFRVQGSETVCDLRSLPSGWRFSPPICQEVVAGVLNRLLQQMPLPFGYGSWSDIQFDHYLDDLLFVESKGLAVDVWRVTAKVFAD